MKRALLALVVVVWVNLTGCMPLPTPPAAVTSAPTRARATFTPPPTLTPEAPAAAATPTPTPLEPPRYAEPAGCQPASLNQSAADRLAYAESLLTLETPLARRQLNQARNNQTGALVWTGQDVLAFSTGGVQNRYRIQDMLNALHVAGFAAWLRSDEQFGEHILAVRLAPDMLESAWAPYVSAFFQAGGVPEGETRILPALRLSPCRWMVQAGLAPDLPVGELEQVDWRQPDFAAAAEPFIASTTEQCSAVAHGIGWLDGRTEAPGLMCGPLTWAITNAAGAFPPGYGAWVNAPKTFWLPKPSENGRPWSLFNPETYVVRRFSDPTGSVDFSQYPLEAGDMVYTYSRQDGFDHLLVVTECDADGNRFSVTNVVKVKPFELTTIQRVLLYAANDPGAGFYRNEWAKDRLNGRTGDGGFEVFRWAWRAKDISGQPAEIDVRPGDSLPLIAARWKTPPEQIAGANGLQPGDALRVGQRLVIPPNP